MGNCGYMPPVGVRAQYVILNQTENRAKFEKHDPELSEFPRTDRGA